MPTTLLVLLLTLFDARPLPPPSAGSRIVFHGWSRSSKVVAYTRVRAGKERSDQRMHRFVEGGAFTGFGSMVGGDVEGYAREHGYVVAPVPRRQVGPNAWELQLGERVLRLELVVGDAVAWRLTERGRELARHVFDRIYVGFDPELYPSPDGAQAVMVLHLDVGWESDAAIFPMML